MPVNAEAASAHTATDTLRASPEASTMKQDTRKNITVHMTLTHVGLFKLENSKLSSICSKLPRKKKVCVCIHPCKYSPKHYFWSWQHSWGWPYTSRLWGHIGRKRVSFPSIWLLSGRICLVRPFVLWTPPAFTYICLCLWGLVGQRVCCTLKNFKTNLTTSFFQLWWHKSRATAIISVRWLVDLHRCESTAAHRSRLF